MCVEKGEVEERGVRGRERDGYWYRVCVCINNTYQQSERCANETRGVRSGNIYTRVSVYLVKKKVVFSCVCEGKKIGKWRTCSRAVDVILCSSRRRTRTAPNKKSSCRFSVRHYRLSLTHCDTCMYALVCDSLHERLLPERLLHSSCFPLVD